MAKLLFRILLNMIIIERNSSDPNVLKVVKKKSSGGKTTKGVKLQRTVSSSLFADQNIEDGANTTLSKKPVGKKFNQSIKKMGVDVR